MADVNPNQDLRFKEIMRRLIPGAYSLVFLQILHGLHGVCVSDLFGKLDSVTIGLADGLTYSLLVVVAYIIGFLNNTIASKTERWLYEKGLIKRPSRLVLTKGSKYSVDNIEKIIRKSEVAVPMGNVCQKQAAQILRIAKKSILRKDNIVEEMFHQSIMARNLLCIHLLSGVVWVLTCNVCLDKTYVMPCIIYAIVGLLLWEEWRRKNIVYVRNIFEEYLRV